MDWKNFGVVTLGCVLLFALVQFLGGPEWLAWLAALAWALLTGVLGIRVKD